MPITAQVHVVKVSSSCLAELPAVLTYLGSYLCTDAQSDLWIAFYTEWAARVAAYLLWDVYDTYSIWYFPPVLRSKYAP